MGDDMNSFIHIMANRNWWSLAAPWKLLAELRCLLGMGLLIVRPHTLLIAHRAELPPSILPHSSLQPRRLSL